MSPLNCPYSNSIIKIMRLIQFDDNELETILSALDDYRIYADDEIAENDLIGGLPVIDRINSIDDKITAVFN